MTEPDNPDLVTGDDGLARPAWAATDPLLREYYDTEWGMPVRDERGVFERVSLEAFQSGLSWATILRKRPALRDAFADFEPVAVARFTARDVERLLADGRIIRNRAKIEATVSNARAAVALRDAPDVDGGLAGLVGQPAILAFALSRCDDERVEAGYATLFALAIVVKIIMVQVLVAV